MIRVLGFMALLLMCGCAQMPPMMPSHPVDLRCDPMCFEPCSAGPWVWSPTDPDAASAWDELIATVCLPLATEVDRCELRRQACAACLTHGRELGVIR